MNEQQDRSISLFWSVVVTAILAPSLEASDPLPSNARRLLATYCVHCHEGDEPEGNVHFQLQPIDWRQARSTDFWERVYNVLERNEMPPSDSDQPSAAAREQVVEWLERQLTQHARPGGTVLRRLNREEYENTIRDLFGMPAFQAPESFPADDSDHGFDNLGETLVLSPPLLAQYLQLATQVADEILPPDQGPLVPESKRYDIGAKGLAQSSLTSIEGDRFRIVSSKSNAHTAGWPARFEAPQSGIYRLTVETTTFQTDRMYYPRSDQPFRLSVYGKMKTAQTYDPFEKIRKLAQFDVEPNHAGPQTFRCEIELVKGEAFGLRWANGPFQDRTFLLKRLKEDRLLHAAMLALGKDPRGMSQAQYYDEIVALQKSDLDLSDARLDEVLEKRGFGGVGQPNGPQLMISWVVHEEFRQFGPALDVVDVSIEGPLQLIEDDEMRARKARTAQFLGDRPAGLSDRQYVEAVLRRFLPRAFRRPIGEQQLRAYVDLAMEQAAASRSHDRLKEGLHVAVRRVLASPHFLYRSGRSGELDDFELASRLSYFLTSSPPDHQLFDLARRGELSDDGVLQRETLRLLSSTRSKNFVRCFTGQWLGTRKLRDIMPDPRLFFYYDAHRLAMTNEVEMFFEEILRENHSIETFIDPDFSYRNRMLNKIYGDELPTAEMQRVKLERGGRQGGVLGLAAVMMATANGVDTHPVDRGVWLLENVFGTPTPEPPTNVPAIAPDTSGATTMRKQLAAHRADDSCARCHDLIDPLGMVLENFDPVGRWRDNYPIFTQPADGEEALQKQFYANTGKGTRSGPAIDSVGILTDGTRLEDVTQLKSYLLDNINIFSQCLTSKLLVYATGRPLNFGDRRIVERIVSDVQAQGNGFRDLIVSIVQSEAFGMK